MHTEESALVAGNNTQHDREQVRNSQPGVSDADAVGGGKAPPPKIRLTQTDRRLATVVGRDKRKNRQSDRHCPIEVEPAPILLLYSSTCRVVKKIIWCGVAIHTVCIYMGGSTSTSYGSSHTKYW